MSQQNAQTPREFLDAVERDFNVKIVFDLSCTSTDKVCERGYFFDQGIDALEQDWSKIEYNPDADPREIGYNNPPFKYIKPWAIKGLAGTDRVLDQTEKTIIDGHEDEVNIWLPGIPVFSLFPVGAGSKWFADYVLGQTVVYFVQTPRIKFVDPTTGAPFLSAKGKPQSGFNDCMLIDWQCITNDGEPGVFSYKWKTVVRKSRKKTPDLTIL